MSNRNFQAVDIEPLVVKAKVAWKMLGCGNTRGYELLASGELDSIGRPFPKNYSRQHQSVLFVARQPSRRKFREAEKMTARGLGGRVAAGQKQIVQNATVTMIIGATGIQFFTIAETAERLCVLTRTILRWIAAGELVAHRFGASVRIAEADLRAFEALHREG